MAPWRDGASVVAIAQEAPIIPTSAGRASTRALSFAHPHPSPRNRALPDAEDRAGDSCARHYRGWQQGRRLRLPLSTLLRTAPSATTGSPDRFSFVAAPFWRRPLTMYGEKTKVCEFEISREKGVALLLLAAFVTWQHAAKWQRHRLEARIPVSPIRNGRVWRCRHRS